MAKKQEIGFWGTVARLFLDHCPECKSLNVTKTQVSKFRVDVETEQITYDYVCQDCGKRWKDTKSKVKKAGANV